LGLQIPEDHPDRGKYFSLQPRNRETRANHIAEITLMSPGDILFLYTDGVYDGSDEQQQQQLEAVMRDNYRRSPKEICTAVLEQAVKNDEVLRQNGDENLIDDKTVFIIKRG
jgi:serine phosphatase RsbU (regulator of sigma subunit)